MSRPSPDALFDGIEQFVADTRRMLEAGAMLNMQGLDDQVRSLCEAVLQLSQEERLLHADRMQQLLADLRVLGDAMVESRDRMADAMRQLSRQKQAVTAYKIADARDDFGRRDREGEGD